MKLLQKENTPPQTLRKQQAGNFPFIALTVDIDGNNVFRCDRSTSVIGGALLHCQENLPVKQSQTSTFLMTKFAKLCFVQVQSPRRCFKLCIDPLTVQSEALNNVWLFINNNFESVSEKFKLNILGDFNYPRVGGGGGGGGCNPKKPYPSLTFSRVGVGFFLGFIGFFWVLKKLIIFADFLHTQCENMHML